MNLPLADMAHLSRIAYLDGQHDYGEYVSLAFIDIESTGTQAHVFQRESVVYVAFRGTEKSLRDICTDLWAVPATHPQGGRVHAGMLAGWESIKGSVTALIDESCCTEVMMTGHSLGGGLSEIAALDLAVSYQSSCVSIAANKIGDANFGRQFRARLYQYVRVANVSDIVTHLAPVWLKHPCLPYRVYSLPPCHGIAKYIRKLGG